MNREGEVTVSVVLARKGGLYAEYFNNAFLDGIPALTRVDNIMNFNWTDGIITEESGDYVSIHWYGKLLYLYSEEMMDSASFWKETFSSIDGIHAVMK